MFYEIFIPVLFGILFGCFTGLIPGIHINLISGIILANLVLLFEYFDTNSLIIFIVSMGVVHTFVDFVPSVLFGVPDADTCLSVLPAHKMVNDGKAYLAVFMSSLGSLLGCFFAFSVAPIFFFFLKSFYDFFKEYVPYFLFIVLVWLIFTEKSLNNKFWAFIVVLFSGGLGLLVLNSFHLNQPLLVLFSGLFGLSTIIHSSLQKNASIKPQNLKINFKLDFRSIKAVFAGGISAAVCSVSPGIGNAQAAMLSSALFKKIDSEYFLIVTGSINTINFILSFLTFYLIERARNGSVYAISQIITDMKFFDLIFYFGIIFIVCIFAFFITLFLGKNIIKFVYKLDIRKINLTIVTFLFLIVFFMTGFYGVLVFLTCSFLGLFSLLLGIKRVHMMGVLLVTVIFNLI